MPIVNREREEAICSLWNDFRLQGMKAKETFLKHAAVNRQYYGDPNHNFIWKEFNADERPDFMVTDNKVYELVSIFGPNLYARNPQRNVEARPGGRPEIVEACSRYLAYTPKEFGLKSSSKEAIDESLIDGRGCMMTGQDAKTGLVMSVTEHTKNLILDPSETLWYNGYWGMRLRRNVPLWIVAKRFGREVAQRLLDEDVVAGQGSHLWESGDTSAYVPSETDQETDNQIRAFDNPRVSYYEVYSKMGIGLRAKKSDNFVLGNDSPDNVLLIYEPTKKIIMRMAPWPIPFWADHAKHSWPWSFVDPAENQNHTWPISLITPAIGLQMFLDWGWSFVMGAIKKTSRSIMVCATDIDGKLMIELKGNKSFVIIPIEETNPDRRRELVNAVNLGELNPALINVMGMVEAKFEKATGLSELLYGQSKRQYRSAAEAEIKADFAQVRPDDVSDRVEEWQSEVARKEAIGARWLLDGQALAPIIGPELAEQWDVYRSGDLKAMMAEYDYTIEFGSMRKRTPQFRADVAAQRLDRMAPLYLSIGDLEGFNRAFMEWEKANGTPEPEQFTLAAQPPPEAFMPNGGQQGQPPEEPQPPTAPEVMAVQDGQPVLGLPGAPQ
ncbi:MAG: hypothetical protein ACYTBJ_01860 [Planctomycetota bacterium]|jgi:hypothetical protein